MRNFIFILSTIFGMVGTLAQEYYPEGTKWTEIRLDTLKYDSWFSKVEGEWTPNFETIEYYVKGDYIKEEMTEPNTYKCVYTNGPEWSDSLALFIIERQSEIVREPTVNATVPSFYDDVLYLYHGTVYQFNWQVGKDLYYQEIIGANIPCIPITGVHCFGTIDEIKEGDFGGEKPLKYVDLDEVRIIQGIGVTEWKSGECLFGPVKTYDAYRFFQMDYFGKEFPDCNYRSRLTHFERDGEVLYDVWPKPGDENSIKGLKGASSPSLQKERIYDLQGRRLMKAPEKGLYIQDGKIKKQP